MIHPGLLLSETNQFDERQRQNPTLLIVERQPQKRLFIVSPLSQMSVFLEMKKSAHDALSLTAEEREKLNCRLFAIVFFLDHAQSLKSCRKMSSGSYYYTQHLNATAFIHLLAIARTKSIYKPTN